VLLDADEEPECEPQLAHGQEDGPLEVESPDGSPMPPDQDQPIEETDIFKQWAAGHAQFDDWEAKMRADAEWEAAGARLKEEQAVAKAKKEKKEEKESSDEEGSEVVASFSSSSSRLGGEHRASLLMDSASRRRSRSPSVSSSSSACE